MPKKSTQPKEPVDWLQYENQAYEEGYRIVCGVDEAGRGPLAGPVFAAAVVLLYGDKPMSVSPCRTCTADCPSKGKEIKPEEAAVTCASTKAKDDINDKIRKLKQQDTGKGEQDV